MTERPAVPAALVLSLLLAACATKVPPPNHAGGAGDAGGPPGADPAPAPEDPPPFERGEILSETVVVRVTGMTCPVRCPREVRDMLLAVPGVTQVIVDYDEREAICHVEPRTDPATILAALRAPYAGKLVER